MHVLLSNFHWMSINIMLALLGVVFGWIVFIAKNTLQRLLWGFLWICFVPNSIYLVTDIIHLPEDLIRFHGLLAFGIIMQYGMLEILGIITFIASLYPIERLLLASTPRKKKSFAVTILVLINIFIAFGVALGRIQRTNSWEIITQPSKVAIDTLNLFNSYQELLFIVIFASVINIIYFSMRKFVIDISYRVLYNKKYNNKRRFFN